GVSAKNGALFGRGEPVGELGYDSAVESAAFATQPGRIAEPIASSSGSTVVLEVVGRKTADPALLPSQRETIRTELRRGRQMLFMNSILQAELEKGGYKRNEEYFKQLGS